MKYFLAMLLLAFSFTATAGTSVNTTGLSDQQRAELALQVVNMQTAADTSAVDEVSKWVDIGASLGQGLAATAKELGITANELADTPVGMIAIAVIVWNYMGESIVGVVFGFFWFLTALPLWAMFYRSRFVLDEITYYDKGAREDGIRKVKLYRKGDADETTIHFFYWLTLILIVGVGLLVVF